MKSSGFLKERKRVRALAGSDAYLRLRLSKYTDAANALKATTATPLNSGTGMLDCSKYTFCPVPDSPGEMDTDQD